MHKNLFVSPGDFLFSRANTIELVGACVIAKKVTKNIMLSDKIIRFILVADLKKWVLYYLRSKLGRTEIESLATGNQESMRNIGQDRIRAIRVPLSSAEECSKIVEEIEDRLSVAEEIDKVIEVNLTRADRLRQSILKKAFSGRLIPISQIREHASA